MRFFASMAAVAACATANTTEIHINWDNDAVDSWGKEWEAEYAAIEQAWGDLLTEVRDEAVFNQWAKDQAFWDLVGPDQVDYTWKEFLDACAAADQELWGKFSTEAQELSEREQDLNEEMGTRAIEYLGQSVTVDGEKLADLVPFFDVESWDASQLLTKNGISTMIARANKGPVVTVEASGDLASLEQWLQMIAQKWESVEAEYSMARPIETFRNKNELKKMLDGMITQIRKPVLRQRNTVMREVCRFDEDWGDYICADMSTEESTRDFVEFAISDSWFAEGY